MDYRIFPPQEILNAEVNLPYSKSIAVRALILDHIASHQPRPELAEICGDTAILAQALPELASSDRIDIGDAGTAMRFLCALAAATPGTHIVITGSERMQQRPIGPLVEALQALGAEIEYCGQAGFPPVKVHGKRLSGGEISIDASLSSQYVSALMLCTPLMENALTVRFSGETPSMPYLHMTAGMLAMWNCHAELDRDGVVVPKAQISAPANFKNERDWSAAAFWYEIVALSGGWASLKDLEDKSLQGDRATAELFGRLGAITEFEDGNAELSGTPDLYNFLEADLSDTPDAAPALAFTAALAGIPFKLSGLGALRIKESDRMQAIIDELLKIGIIAETADYDTALVWEGQRVPVRELPTFNPHGDHRMAMALAPVSIFIPGIVITDAECVEKSYPGYWSDLAEAGFTLADPAEPLEEAQE